MLIIEKYTTAIVLETVESRWTEIFYFAKVDSIAFFWERNSGFSKPL